MISSINKPVCQVRLSAWVLWARSIMIICTYLGFRVDVDPVCLSLAVLRGSGPAPALRPVVGIRNGQICSLCPPCPETRVKSKMDWALGPESPRARPGTPRRTPPSTFLCTTMVAFVGRKYGSTSAPPRGGPHPHPVQLCCPSLVCFPERQRQQDGHSPSFHLCSHRNSA